MLRGIVLLTLQRLRDARELVRGNPQLGMLTKLANFPTTRQLCPNPPGEAARRRPTGSTRGSDRVIKQAPSVGRILTMVAFALSCFGILMFLWLSFGGSVPLRPRATACNVEVPRGHAARTGGGGAHLGREGRQGAEGRAEREDAG